jgi:DNA-binding NarL/FixJ family response regulator
MSSRPIRTLIVDDGELFAESLRRVLTQMSNDTIEVCAIAHTGEQAVEYARLYQPDVVLMDLRLPDIDGIEATRRILEIRAETSIVVLTNFDDDEYVYDAIDAGAAGYLLKDITPERLRDTIESANRDSMVFASSIAAKLSKNRSAAGRPNMPDWFGALSRREREVLACLVRGQTNKEIADSLHIAEQTVRNNVSEIYFKSDIHDRTKLVEAVRIFLLADPDSGPGYWGTGE